MFYAAPQIVRKLENESIAPPKARTLIESFIRLTRDRRSESKRNIAASGISETSGEREQQLDDCTSEIDAKKEEEEQKKGKQKEIEAKLKAKGEEIRTIALENAKSTTKETNEDSVAEYKTPLKKKRRTLRSIFSIDPCSRGT